MDEEPEEQPNIDRIDEKSTEHETIKEENKEFKPKKKFKTKKKKPLLKTQNTMLDEED